jgi:hypothetical protein
VATHVDEALRSFENGPQRDDVALLVLRATGAPAAEPAVLAGVATRPGS